MTLDTKNKTPLKMVGYKIGLNYGLSRGIEIFWRILPEGK
jgi:hypothetical protein